MTEAPMPETVERLLDALDEVHEAARLVAAQARREDDHADRGGTTRAPLRLITTSASRPAGESTSR